ncbi:hypothetical protein EH244_07165 [Variovorax beijingensis]|uniref:Lipoprotein n=1 Tax=Variovorax beijingensis TaxID=2496117 RepID=A0A3P3EVS5_9BURK|nr:hypothetical protein [Variovorax beijingensis]RRH90514.1 hypothetical protein EH244_07165 [Variovorax beijingensis]RSZ34626.1 hypothetical protein EJO66_17305 [Variovorax beijingensis]
MKLLNPLPRSFMDLLRLDAGMSLQKLMSLLAATALLAGCAADASKPTLQARQDATRSAAKVELIYNEEDQLIVTDGGGSGLTGFAGLLLGPIGALVALTIDTNSRMTMAARTDQRSKEFTAAVRNSGTTMALNRQFAEQLAARLRESGREVKLTPFMRATGAASEMKVPELQPTPGYSTLILRITTAYGAADATSSFKPFISVEQLLRDERQSVVHQTAHTADVSEPTYFSYEGLLKDTAVAHEGLKQGLDRVVQPAYAGMFGGDQPRAVPAETTRTAGLDAK